MNDLRATATRAYDQAQPTIAPTTVDLPTAAPTLTPELIPPTTAPGGFDLAALLNQAQNAVTQQRWQEAVDLLDVILGVDPAFEAATVRRLMQQSLNSLARDLYNANQPAAANLIVNRAEEFGALADGLSYERYAAELFLTARAAVGTGSPNAISRLREVINLGAGGRYYAESIQLLYQVYVTRGDAAYNSGNPCGAVADYQNAINLLASGAANGKRAAAQTACNILLSAPTPDPLLPPMPGDAGIAPIGVPGT